MLLISLRIFCFSFLRPRLVVKCLSEETIEKYLKKKSYQFSCSSCGFVTKHKFSLFLHRKRHDEKVQCSICEKFVTNIDRHRKIHFLKKSFSCNLCDYKTKFSKNLKIHARIHNKTKCKICSKLVSDLKEHQRKVHREMRFACDACNYKTNVKSSIRLHILNHNKSRCPICKKLVADIVRHVKNVHTSERLFSCDVCDYKTKVSSSLRRHKITHEKPSECPECKKMIFDKKLHIKNVHGEKKSCKICGKIMASRHLGYHMKRVHKEFS